MSARLPPAQHGAVLAGIKATPSGCPPASLDPGCGRRPPATTGSPAEVGIRQNQVSTVSGDCRLHKSHWSRLWESNRRPTHYENPPSRLLVSCAGNSGDKF